MVEDAVADVIVIGGGVMGCSASYFLALRGAKVVVIEQDASYAKASSALSASSIRQQFSTPVCMEMSRYGFEFLRSAGEDLSVAGEAVDIGLVEQGYLYLADARAGDSLASAIGVQQSQGVPVQALGTDELSIGFPWLNTADLQLGALGLRGEGWFDGYSLLQAFRRKAASLGVRFVEAKAVGVEKHAGRIDTVIAGESRLTGGAVLNAAGFSAGEVAGWAGVQVPIAPERRCVFVLDCPGAPGALPLVVDPSGFYVRPEGRYFIAGGAATPHPGCDAPCFEVDFDQFDGELWPALAHRIPAFETLKRVNAWAGQYEMNLFDHNAVIGSFDEAPGFYITAGFSGHGMQHAAAAGRGVAELILDGGFQTLDLTPLSPARLAEGRPLRELNII